MHVGERGQHPQFVEYVLGGRISGFDVEGRPTARVEAETAKLIEGAWELTGTKTWDLTSANPELTAQREAGPVALPSDLTPERIRDSFGTPSAIMRVLAMISASGLPWPSSLPTRLLRLCSE